MVVKIVSVPIFCFFLSSCAGTPAVQGRIRRLADQGDFVHASEVFSHLERGSYGKNNRLLEALDRGMILHYAQQYSESIEAFEQAKRIYDQLYTESVSKIAASWLWNDTALPYAGEDFERAAINIFQALNFIALGDYEDALVEARNAGSFLQQVNDRYAAGEKNSYSDDAFVRFLMGILYESYGDQNDMNNAFISYKKAFDIYENKYVPNFSMQTPMLLKEKLFLAAKWMGGDQFRNYQNRFSDFDSSSLQENQGYAEIYLIFYRGQIVNKVSSTIVLPGMDGLLTRISFPRYRNSFKPKQVPVFSAKSGADTIRAPLFKVEDWDAIARKNLNDRRLRILAKAVARPMTKQVLIEAAQDKVREKAGDTAGEFFQYAGNFYLLYSEQADLRAWETLPADAYLARLLLPKGDYHFFVGDAAVAHFSVDQRERKFIMHWSGF